MARNETLEKAIETTDEEDLALLLFDYSHFDSRGDLGEKATILSSIWKFYEINKDSIKKQFPSLSNSIGKIANRCDIRHSLSSSDKAFLRHCL